MRDEIREFVIDSLTEMNYDVEGLDDDTTLGPAGVDLQSLALAELAVRVEDRFGVRFGEDESEELAGMTVGEFCATVAERLAADAGTETGAGTAPAGDVLAKAAGE